MGFLVFEDRFVVVLVLEGDPEVDDGAPAGPLHVRRRKRQEIHPDQTQIVFRFFLCSNH